MVPIDNFHLLGFLRRSILLDNEVHGFVINSSSSKGIFIPYR